jgi:hypoxanthine phosphoribosyltransferase
VLISAQRIEETVRDLAARITDEHPVDEPLVIVAVMKGAVIFLADLVRQLAMPLQIELVAACSYEGTRRGDLRMVDGVESLEVSGRHVLLLDCVLDTGRTLGALFDALQSRAPASLEVCVLLSKRRPREVPLTPRYVGICIPDVFVVGYGLDCGGLWRHLPYVAELPASGDEPGGAG